MKLDILYFILWKNTGKVFTFQLLYRNKDKLLDYRDLADFKQRCTIENDASTSM